MLWLKVLVIRIHDNCYDRPKSLHIFTKVFKVNSIENQIGEVNEVLFNEGVNECPIFICSGVPASKWPCFAPTVI